MLKSLLIATCALVLNGALFLQFAESVPNIAVFSKTVGICSLVGAAVCGFLALVCGPPNPKDEGGW